MKKLFCALLLTTATLLSCGGADTTSATGPPPALVEPGEPAYASVLRPQLEQLREETLAPGLVVLVRSETLGNFTAQLGTRTFGGSDPVQLTDHVRVGSVTKTMTGTVILQLVGEGRLSLSDPVANFVPQVPNGQNITIAQLLDMSSGLFNYTETLELNQILDDDPQHVFSPQEVLTLAFQHDPYFPPGEGYHYSNTNTVLLGLIIEQLTGQSASAAFQDRIFRPLGISQTSLPALSDSSIPLEHPLGYQFGTNVETIRSQVLPPDQQAAAFSGALSPLDMTNSNPGWGWTAGSGISTAEDLLVYGRALAAGGLLPDNLQQLRLASVKSLNPNDPQAPGYGLALARFGNFYGHTGELPGFNTFMAYDPTTRTTLVCWSNLSAGPDGRPPAVAAARLTIGVLSGAGEPEALPDQEGPLD